MDRSELNKKYVGKEVLYKGQLARIEDITSSYITIKIRDNGYCFRFDTGTGPNENAIANGYIQFLDKELNKEFIEEYEEYVHSAQGREEAFMHNSWRYN